MKVYTLYREQYLPISIEKAWDFFSSAKNLDKITPPEMGFSIISELGDEPVHSGMLIKYTVKPLWNIKMKWVTQIVDVSAPHSFTDRQIKGPYKLWEHTHHFHSVAGGVKMTDEVKYGLPLGWLGILAHSLVVKSKLEQIFDFRAVTLKNFFGQLNERGHVAG